MCTAQVPHPATLLPDDACEALALAPGSPQRQPTAAAPVPAAAAAAGPAAIAAAPIFYLHSKPGDSCAVANPRLSWDNYEAAYNPDNAIFDPAGDGLTLRMQGADGVRVVARRAQLWGMLGVRARVSGLPGVITAAYVSRALRRCAGPHGCPERVAPGTQGVNRDPSSVAPCRLSSMWYLVGVRMRMH